MLTRTFADTPLGRVLLVATGIGVVRLAFETEGFDEVIASEAARRGEEALESASPVLGAARAQLEEYFAGLRREFDLPLDRSGEHGFYGEVRALLPSIPYGTTLSYSALAAAAGRPKAHRAAASACATNPLPILVPCHRVMRRDGSFGGYLAGLEAKRFLLDLEAGDARPGAPS